ncbi:hypothetical protein GOD64_28230 [Sinorhizobium medicae]|nr:hypothetical protein [Sinorhizobium medicae]
MKWCSLPLLLLLTFAGGVEAQSIDSHAFWHNFRKTSPFPIQDIIASPITSSGDVTLILTEPPPEAWRSREELLRRAFPNPQEIISTNVEFYPIGFDGWVKDIVVTLRGVSDEEIEEGVRTLNEAYYGTTYGASYRVVEPHSWDAFAAPRRHIGPPNLRINAASLNEWLLGAKASLVDRSQRAGIGFGGAEETPFKLTSVFDTRKTGVFHSNPSGLVLLVLNREQQMNSSRALVRQFTVDTDALLGAVTKENSSLLVLVGRLRSTSMSHMPPLRVDTLLTLAATSERDLAQSYERRAPLAGPTSDAELRSFLDPSFNDATRTTSLQLKFPLSAAADWAPILLSRDLTNTEFGQLLNITDQMLKGWSEANLVAYGNFPYPVPRNFPEPSGVFAHLRNRLGSTFSELTYNWNTSGYGSWTQFGDYEIFAILNTNALPVSYIPEGTESGVGDRQKAVIREIEDEFGEYYATLRDPTLSRVAQYAAIHVIFTKYPVKAIRTEPLTTTEAYDQRWAKYKNVVSDVLRRLNGSSAVEAAANGRSASCGVEEAAPVSLNAEMSTIVSRYATDDKKREQLVDVLVDADQFTRPIRLAFEEHQNEVEAHVNQVEAYNQLAGICQLLPSDTRCSSLMRERARLETQDSKLSNRDMDLERQRAELDSLLSDGKKLRDLFPLVGDCGVAWRSVRDARIDEDDFVFKTPSIVVSTDVQGMSSGGHNLYGRSVEVVPDVRVKAGSFEIDPTGNVIRVNPDEAAKSATIGREFERNRFEYLRGDDATKRAIEERISASIKSEAVVAQPLTAETLELAENATAAAWGASSERHAIGTVVGRLPEEQLKGAVQLADASKANLVVGSRNGLYSVVDRGPPPLAIQTKSPFEMLRAIEVRAARAANAKADSSFVVVSDGSLSLADMDGIRISAQTRQMIAEAGGGGDKGLPPKGKIGFFFEKDPPPNGPRPGKRDPGGDEPPGRKPGDPGKDGWNWLGAFPFNERVRQALTRTDADWRAASLSQRVVEIDAETRAIVNGFEIPIKRSPNGIGKEPSLFVTLKTFFKKRAPTEDDAQILDNIVATELANAADGTAIQAKLISIRDKFKAELKGDAVLQGSLRQNDLDFMVVEIMTHVLDGRG